MYFVSCLLVLRQILGQIGSEALLAYLILARHADGRGVAGFEPHRVSGAGVNALREKGGLSEEAGRGVIEALKEGGFIEAAPETLRKTRPHARWILSPPAFDLPLPNALVDPLKIAGEATEPPLKRLKKQSGIVSREYGPLLQDVADTTLLGDALMLLIEGYATADMERFGGFDPSLLRRVWDVKSRIPHDDGLVRWGAEAGVDMTITDKMGNVVLAEFKKTTNKLDEVAKARFWQAAHTLKEAGLIYEAVTLFDTSVDNKDAHAKLTLRVNDWHAGAVDRKGDPCLLRELELSSGTRLAFYTPVSNDRYEPESLRVFLPDSRGEIVGVWRPRFRPATPNVGRWVERDKQAIAEMSARINAVATADA